MGRIVVSDNVSLDGVIQDPAGDEGFRVGGWVGRIMDRKELAKVTLDEAHGFLVGGLAEEALASTEHDREYDQPQLVDEVVLDQRASELIAGRDDDFSA